MALDCKALPVIKRPLLELDCGGAVLGADGRSYLALHLKLVQPLNRRAVCKLYQLLLKRVCVNASI